MSPIAITVLLLGSLGGFFFFLAKKMALVTSLQPDPRFDNRGARLKKVLTFGFMQERMIKGDLKAGVMHCIIFYGFMTLLFRKLQLFTIGYSQFFVYPEPFGGYYAWLKDLVEILVILALVFAFWRRFINRPIRLEPNKEAVTILCLILAIMVTDLLYDGFKFALHAGSHEALAHEAQFAFAGNWIAGMLTGMSQSSLNLGYHLFYWIQIATVLSFLVYLPLGEHFHIITALPELYFSTPSPLNKVPKVDLEALMDEDDESEEEPKVGIQTALDLTWKEGLDVFTCTECGRCKDSCPTFLTDKPLSLKWVNDSLKHHLWDERHKIVEAKEKAGEVEFPDLVGDIISPETLWACTTCGFCEAACPIELEHLSKFYKMRQYKVMMDGEFPEELQGAFDNYERQSNPWGINSATRGDWAKDLDVPLLESPEQSKELDFLFYVGSAQSFDTRNQKVAKAFVKILNAAGAKFAILGADEGSTGECVRRAGNEMLFQELATQLVESLNELEVKKIVTCDPHAYNSLKNEYPEFEGKYEVIHHTELIDQYLNEGKIKVDAKFEKVIYHEPCYIGRHNQIYDQPRQVLKRITKDGLMEFEMKREKAMCCGAGGARMWMEETIGSRINVTRVEQALPKNPKVIATACPYCTIMITDGVADRGKEEEIATKDIAELVAESLIEA